MTTTNRSWTNVATIEDNIVTISNKKQRNIDCRQAAIVGSKQDKDARLNILMKSEWECEWVSEWESLNIDHHGMVWEVNIRLIRLWLHCRIQCHYIVRLNRVVMWWCRLTISFSSSFCRKFRCQVNEPQRHKWARTWRIQLAQFVANYNSKRWCQIQMALVKWKMPTMWNNRRHFWIERTKS